MREKIMNALGAIFKQLWALCSDGDWDFDPYKLGGFAAYVIAGVLVFRLFDLAVKIDGTALATLAGLVGLIAGLGTSLFGMARKVDAAQTASKGPGLPGGSAQRGTE